jgi:hypothetical protein
MPLRSAALRANLTGSFTRRGLLFSRSAGPGMLTDPSLPSVYKSVGS